VPTVRLLRNGSFCNRHVGFIIDLPTDAAGADILVTEIEELDRRNRQNWLPTLSDEAAATESA